MTAGEEIRLRLVLHYDGSGFHGWQIQPDRRTVQGVLQAAAGRLTSTDPTLTGSGRTDRGVHATGQVASVVVPSSWSAADFRDAMNAVVPDDVWVEDCRRAPSAFHPRFDAVARTYQYRLGTTEESRSPFLRPFCWPLGLAVDLDALNDAAAAVPGERSFEAFAKSGQPERGTRCHVHEASWEPWGEQGLLFSITADRYLHHMVRYLVGTMVAVASGKRPRRDLVTLLDEGPSDDLWTSAPAPAEGLYLHRVEYPEEKVRFEDESTSADPTHENSTLLESPIMRSTER